MFSRFFCREVNLLLSREDRRKFFRLRLNRKNMQQESQLSALFFRQLRARVLLFRTTLPKMKIGPSSTDKS
jgi:hypothetical protein